MLRNPINRAFSHYHHQVRKGREPLTFEEAIEAEEERLSGEKERILRDDGYYSYNYWAYSYKARGIYADQLKAWFDVFDKNQFFILRSEDFFKNPDREYKKTLRFLDVSQWALESYGSRNVGSYDKMDDNTRNKLSEYFRPHNEKLYDLLGVNFGWDE